MKTHTITKNVLASKMSMYIHPTTGFPLQPTHQTILTTCALVWKLKTVAVGGILFTGRLYLLDTGVEIDYEDYRILGIRAFSDIGMPDAANVQLLVNPTMIELGPILADLCSSSVPSSLCRRQVGENHIPDYVKLLKGDFHGLNTLVPATTKA